LSFCRRGGWFGSRTWWLDGFRFLRHVCPIGLLLLWLLSLLPLLFVAQAVTAGIKGLSSCPACPFLATLLMIIEEPLTLDVFRGNLDAGIVLRFLQIDPLGLFL